MTSISNRIDTEITPQRSYLLSQRIQRAADWIWESRNDDGGLLGWGVTKGAHSSIANTAEAVFVLTRSSHRYDLTRSIDTIKSLLSNMSKKRRTRYYAYALFGLMDLGVDENDSTVQAAVNILSGLQNNDGGWSHDEGLHSSTFATFLALMAERVNPPESVVARGLNWLLRNQNEDGGWGLQPGSESTLAHTAFAVNVLLDLKHQDHVNARRGLAWLLNQPERWLTVVREEVAGAPSWNHYSYAWISRTLSLANGVLEEGRGDGIGYVDRIISLTEYFSHPNGGFKESEVSSAPTVPSTSAAVRALKSIEKLLPPIEHLKSVRLTPRELQILRLLWESPHLTRVQLSVALSMSEATARNYINRINEKLATRQVLEACIKAKKVGLITFVLFVLTTGHALAQLPGLLYSFFAQGTP